MTGALRILVTGANGQVGHELLRALAATASPSMPLRSERGRRAASRFDPASTASSSAEQRLREGTHPLPPEGDRRAASGGCDGAAGSSLALPWAVLPATRTGRLEDGAACEAVDLADRDALRAALDRIAPDVILNAAAYTAVDRAEDEPELAQRVNGAAPGLIGEWAALHGARVVHYSTDYVFDGTAARPYREEDPTRPVSAYGRSKLAGEAALRDSGARHLIVRTAWVYAARGHNFLLTMLRLGAERDVLRVVDDQAGAPTPAAMIADTTVRMLRSWLQDDSGDGVYHVVASGQVTWCGFARAIFERAHAVGLLERAPRVDAIGTADYPTRARRPAYSVLDTGKVRAGFGIALPDWEAGLDSVIRELAN